MTTERWKGQLDDLGLVRGDRIALDTYLWEQAWSAPSTVELSGSDLCWRGEPTVIEPRRDLIETVQSLAEANDEAVLLVARTIGPLGPSARRIIDHRAASSADGWSEPTELW